MKELYSVPTSPFTALSPLAASPSLSLPGGFRTSPYSLTDSIKSFSVRGSFSSSLPVAASVGEGEEVACGVTGEGGGGGTPSLRAMAFSMSIRKERSSVEEGSKERPRVIALMRYKEGKVWCRKRRGRARGGRRMGQTMKRKCEKSAGLGRIGPGERGGWREVKEWEEIHSVSVRLIRLKWAEERKQRKIERTLLHHADDRDPLEL
jgi:hypothetical protein